MILTTPYERALEDLDTQLAPVRKHRERVIALVKETINRVSAAKNWRSAAPAADDVRLAFKALDQYRDLVRQMDLSLIISGNGNPVVAKALDGLRIENHGSEINVSPLYRVLGQEADQKATFRRIENILKSPQTLAPRRDPRKAPFSRVYKLYNDGRRDVAQRINWSNPAVNEAEMSLTMTICTDAVDREKEVIIPTGVEFTDYRRNPVVLYEHGLDPNFPTPVGRCETPGGKLALTVTEHSILATCYFIRGDADSEKVWNLVRNGAIRCASIHVLPTANPVRRVIDGKNATIYPKSSMVEWSLGRIPVNQEATV